MNMNLVFTRQNAVFLSICLTGLLLLAAISIVPQQAEKHELRRRLPEVRQRIRRQKQIQEIMAALEKNLAAQQRSPLPEFSPSPLPFEQTGRLLSDLRRAAEANRLAVRTIYPDLKGREKNWKLLTVRSELQGGINGIRGFLLDFLTLPYVSGIQRVHIVTGDGVLTLRLTFTVNLS